MKRALLRAIAASALVAVVTPAILFLTVAKAGVPKPGVQAPSNFHEWSYHDQNEWRLKNFEMVGGIAYIRERMKHPESFATEYAISVASIFVVGFASCVLFVLLGGLRSNTTPHPDARDVPAPAKAPGARAGGRER